MKILAVLALSAVLLGCQKTPIQRHPATATDPGSTTQLDADAYDALLVTDTLIKSTKTSLAAGSYGTKSDSVKTILNATIKYYDIAQSAYVVEHANQSAAQLIATLRDALATMKQSSAQLATATKGN